MGSGLLLSSSSSSGWYMAQLSIRLMYIQWVAGVVIDICNILKIGRWFERRLVSVCHLVEVTKGEMLMRHLANSALRC